MSRKKWNEEDIEQTLTDMPKIEDKQSKDEIFQAVRQGMAQEPAPKKKKQWFFPMAATAAAALLVLLMVPSLMNTGLFTSDTQTGSEMDVQNDAGTAVNMEEENEQEETNDLNENNSSTNNNMNTGENDSAEEDTNEENEVEYANEAPLNNTNNEGENEADRNMADNNNSNQRGNEPLNNEPAAVEYAVTEEDAAYVTASVNEEEQVVITAHERNGASLEEVLLRSLQESDPTLDGLFSNQLEEVQVNEPEQGQVVLQFAEGTLLESMSSTEYTHTENVLQEIFSYHRITEVHFQAGEEEASFGQSGESSLSISTLNRGYYQDDSGAYVSAREAGEPTTNGTGDPLSFEETVEEMEQAENGFESALPESIEVEEVFTENGTGVVQFTAEDAPQEDIEQLTRAIQLTAGGFDLHTIELVDDTNEEIIQAPVHEGE
ncbi:hypothetical protein [Alkalicoccus chagannorensis]|uniref:hypothetical protein n=1 Tax=Alkalicoccus chagannorensis TaxID=427072 RepID=UPI0004046B99|nr:hypothetical protein [Alkalicoccus chagannorensis]